MNATTPRIGAALACAIALACQLSTFVEAAPEPLRADITVRRIAAIGSNSKAVRVALDPTSGVLHVLRIDGRILRVDLELGELREVFRTETLGLPYTQGMAFGPEGHIYIVGNIDGDDSRSVGTVVRGERIAKGSDERRWSTVFRTAPYPLGHTPFDHRLNGIAVSPDGAELYINSGSRTDHGEVASAGGLFPGLREVPLTAVILRVPADATDLVLENDGAALAAGGFIFASGVRNTFDLAFDAAGELFGTENSGTRDDSEEINWLRPGRHYGHPWRAGGNWTPQQFPDYDPDADLLIHPENLGYFSNDPDYPQPPPGLELVEPIVNHGPDGDRFADPETGAIRDASDEGGTVTTLTAHRSPLGLVFDTARAMGDDYRGRGFVLGHTPQWPSGTGPLGPRNTEGQDLLLLDLRHAGGAYELNATKIVRSFERCIDAEIVSNRIYVIEYANSGTLWELTFPPASLDEPLFRRGFVNADTELDLSDAIQILLHLFGGATISCEGAADFNADDRIDVSDPVALLGHLFQGHPPPPPPASDCGTAPDATLSCESTAACD